MATPCSTSPSWRKTGSTSRDMNKAESLCTGAARAGNFKAQYRLGMLYSAGELLPRDDAKARIYLTMAAGR